MTVHVAGNLNLDILLGPVATWPQPGTELIVPDNTVRVGGAAANAALALHALGTPLELHADVGDDAFGSILLRELSALGTGAADVRRVPWPTAYSVGVIHIGDERTFLTSLGHLAHYDPAALVRALAASRGDTVLLCGYFLVPPMRGGGLREVLSAARARQHVVAFDTGWPSGGWTDEVRAELDEILPHVELVLPNAGELSAWTGIDDVEKALASLEERGPRVVVKLGPEGAAWLESGRLQRAPAEARRVVDTVGAGDAFNAGLLAALHRGYELGSAVAVGVRCAGLTIASDPRSFPSWSQVAPAAKAPPNL